MRKFYPGKILSLIFFLTASGLSAQNVAINTSGNIAYVSAILDLSNNNTVGTVGFLPPYVTLTALTSFNPAMSGTAAQSNGIIVYNTGGAVAAGLYYWNNAGTTWVAMGGGGSLVTAANDGTSLSGTTVILGGAFNSTLGQLTQNTEIPFNGKNLSFSTGGAGAGKIGIDVPVNTPAAQALEIAGAANTARMDGLGSAGTVYNQVSALNVGNLVYANNASGDLWSIPAPAAASVLVASSTGVLSWQNGTVPTGSGTLNYLARWTPSGSVLGIGITQDNGFRVGIQTGAYGFAVGNILQVTGNATDLTAIYGTTAQATGYGVKGYNTSGGGTAAGVYGNSTSGTGFGVQGVNSAVNGAGVQGYNTATTGTSAGVQGYIGGAVNATSVAAGVYGSSTTASTYGVLGSNSATTGTTVGSGGYIGTLSTPPYPTGIYGGTQTASTFGVIGKNALTTGIAIGVGGFGDNYVPAMPATGAGGMFASNNVGSWNTYNSVSYYGIGGQGVGYFGSNTVYAYDYGLSGNIGNTGHNGDAGVQGYVGALLATPNTPSGVMGIANVSNTNGVYGYNVTGNVGSNGSGVVGFTYQSQGLGVMGGNLTATGAGVFGYGGNATGTYYLSGEGVMGNGVNFGVMGYTNTTPYAGVFGLTSSNTSYFTSNEGVMGSGVYGVMGYGTSYGGFFESTSGWYAYVGGGGWKILGNGSVSTEVIDDQKQYRVLTCPEAPEVLFEDFGSATLSNGKVHVDLDKLYANNVTISDKHPLRVIITLNDQCNGVFVTNRTSTGFDVIELNNGTSNASFTYEVVANRAALYNDKNQLMENFADERFQVGPGPIKATGLDKDAEKTVTNSGVQKVNGEKQDLKKPQGK